MPCEIKPFTEDHLGEAVALFAQNYSTARLELPLLPMRAIDDREWIATQLQTHLKKETGFVYLRDNRLVGYMLSCYRFPFKGQRTAICQAYAHAAELRDGADIYRQLYAALATAWAADGIQLHIVSHLAANTLLKETLYQLGFGAILAERLRAVECVGGHSNATITCETKGDDLADLHAEHMAYYAQAPIFVYKDSSRQEAQRDLQERAGKDEFLLYRENNGRPRAYFIVGEPDGHEGFLLHSTHTAQIKDAYVQAHLRGQGIGRALLDQAIAWAKGRGLARIFVEHETANRHGSYFWSRHFAPYLYISARYVDKML